LRELQTGGGNVVETTIAGVEEKREINQSEKRYRNIAL